VAVVCGAGINAVGVAPDGQVTRYLALGTISGDWGGGYGLGLEVLWHAIRAEDGRGPATVLTQYLTSHFGVHRVEEITIGVHKGKIGDNALTGLAPTLLRAADEGDQVAQTVVNRLGDEISVMAITAMRRLGLTALATPVVLGGGVITARNPRLMTNITRQLAGAAPHAVVLVHRRAAGRRRRAARPGSRAGPALGQDQAARHRRPPQLGLSGSRPGAMAPHERTPG
jgi:N-acetylglucosamine kinase-like BadF-type ATPase